MAGTGIEMVSFRITGVSPLLHHNPDGMVAPPVEEEVTKKKAKRDSTEEEARKHAYIDENGLFYLKSRAFRNAIIDACAGARIGKLAATTAMRGSIFTTVQRVTLLDPDTDKPLKKYVVDTQRAVVNDCGILRSRPRFDRWACNLDLEMIAGKVTSEILLEMLNVAGHAIGVGDFRIQKGGEYGRFVATLLDNTVSKPKAKKTAAA